MNLPDFFNPQKLSISQRNIDEILSLNKEMHKDSLTLAEDDAKAILKTRDKLLNNLGRVDINLDTTKKIIISFSSSAFINDENYLFILNDLQEAFYYIKNETEDAIGDDKIIGLMKDAFENQCEGSIELLNVNLEKFARNFRSGRISDNE
ncbi:hypothetical protein IAI10_09155 [Clostridium sp. 19966]|uniref:DUF6323 family protein n=1 Tax=Clostridium sp. 19966 TaxID=2768166 RepID=UPI0028E08BA5|nr:DUF6323 family protein [Clostridium sp. 19966]MDT8716825.1 hypothetical protein [Clostridium sp. 19966]